MVGSVLHQEMLIGSRHGRWHWLRWMYAAWLLVLLQQAGFMAIMTFRRPNDLTTLSLIASLFLQYFTVQHFVVLTLATPALAAGAITDEKTRGTLQYLLTADLLSWELILGKLLGRGYQVVMLALMGLPPLCFFGVFAGLGVVKVLGFAACSVVLIFAISAASTLASVWCRQTRDAVLSLYFVGCVVAVVVFLYEWFWPGDGSAWLEHAVELLNPFMPIGPNWEIMDDADYLGRLGFFTLCWGGLGLVCLVAAVSRLRRAYRRQLEGDGRARKERWWHSERPPIGDSPLAWKERQVDGIAPLGVLRHIPTWLGVTLVFTISLLVYGWLLLAHLPAGTGLVDLWQMLVAGELQRLLDALRTINIPHEVFYNTGLAMVLVAALVVGVRCSGTVTREREKQTWEALLMTPLTTRQLLRGKLWGITGACVPYLIAFAIPAVVLSVVAGPAPLCWTALWLAVVMLAVWYAGAAGIWCSVGAKSSWRSLFNTLGFIYLGGVALSFVLLFLAAVVTAFLTALLFIFWVSVWGSVGPSFPLAWEQIYRVAISIVLALAFFILSWRLLVSAEKRVGFTERTRHWEDEPTPRRRRRSSGPRRRLPDRERWLS